MAAHAGERVASGAETRTGAAAGRGARGRPCAAHGAAPRSGVVYSGGLFHYKKGSPYSTTDGALELYQDVENNTLLNDVFFYIFHHLPTFQNMHGYRLTKGMDLSKFVHTKFLALVSPPAVPETYMISKELVAYLETLVTFTPYYKADAPRMSGKMEMFYAKALKRYQRSRTKIFTSTSARS